MNSTLSLPALSTSNVSTRPGPMVRLAGALIRRQLRPLHRGRLALRWPDGRTERFGPSGLGPEVTIQVHRWEMLPKLAVGSDLGLAQSYIDGDWDTEDVEKLLTLLIANAEALDGRTLLNRLGAAVSAGLHAIARNTRAGSRRNIAAHYDLGNDFYRMFLDPSMTYSSAVFEYPGQPLQAAQMNKYRRLARMARLRPGDRVLELGCGWGGFAEFAASELGCHVTGITLSREQERFARERLARAGLAERTEVRLQDYRDVRGQFDAIVSIEMLEAVGHHYLPTYFAACDRLLGPDGVATIQVITIPEERYAASLRRPDFIKTHVFPGSHLPSLTAMTRALEPTRLHVDRVENIGPHYAETLRHWRRSFLARRKEVLELGFEPQFVRLWEYYLSYSAAAFQTRYTNDLQILLTRQANPRLGWEPA